MYGTFTILLFILFINVILFKAGADVIKQILDFIIGTFNKDSVVFFKILTFSLVDSMKESDSSDLVL